MNTSDHIRPDLATNNDIDAILRLPRLNESFPVAFANGVQWSMFSLHCPKCARILPTTSLLGRVFHLTHHMAQVDCFGVCRDCRSIQSLQARIYDDRRLMMLRDGRWSTWQFTPIAPWIRPFYRLLRWARGVRPQVESSDGHPGTGP